MTSVSADESPVTSSAPPLGAHYPPLQGFRADLTQAAGSDVADRLALTCGWAVTIARPGRAPLRLAGSEPLATQLDAIAHQTGEDPAAALLGAAGDSAVLDLDTEARWPGFVRRCLDETPVRSMLSIGLAIPSDIDSVVSFFSPLPRAFHPSNVRTARQATPILALAVTADLERSRVAHLEIALQNSRRIGTAIGILMAREDLTGEAAFDRLRHISKRSNRKLRDVATSVVEGHVIEDLDRPQSPRAAS